MSKTESKPRTDIYTRITEKIVADLEKGVRPWMKPWHAGHALGRVTRPLRHNGLPYSGMNVLLLWSEAVARGFASPTWMTFRQALELGGAVRKGETGSMVVFASRYTKTNIDGTGEEVDREIPFLKAYTVFNVGQIDGLPTPRKRGTPGRRHSSRSNKHAPLAALHCVAAPRTTPWRKRPGAPVRGAGRAPSVP